MCSEMNGWSERSRSVAATVAVVIPGFVEIGMSLAWWGSLPDHIAVHFAADGTADRFSAPLPTVIVFAAIQSLFMTAAIGSAFARDRWKARIACTVTAAFVNVVGAGWLAIAAAAIGAAGVVTWALLLAGLAWSLVPYLCLTSDFSSTSPRGGPRTQNDSGIL